MRGGRARLLLGPLGGTANASLRGRPARAPERARCGAREKIDQNRCGSGCSGGETLPDRPSPPCTHGELQWPARPSWPLALATVSVSALATTSASAWGGGGHFGGQHFGGAQSHAAYHPTSAPSHTTGSYRPTTVSHWGTPASHGTPSYPAHPTMPSYHPTAPSHPTYTPNYPAHPGSMPSTAAWRPYQPTMPGRPIYAPSHPTYAPGYPIVNRAPSYPVVNYAPSRPVVIERPSYPVAPSYTPEQPSYAPVTYTAGLSAGCLSGGPVGSRGRAGAVPGSAARRGAVPRGAADLRAGAGDGAARRAAVPRDHHAGSRSGSPAMCSRCRSVTWRQRSTAKTRRPVQPTQAQAARASRRCSFGIAGRRGSVFAQSETRDRDHAHVKISAI